MKQDKTASTTVRWVLTIVAVILNALGVAFITIAGLGTVPATAIPHVTAIVSPRFTLGEYLFVLSVLQIVLQVILLRREFKLFQLTQIIPAVVLSYFVDFFMLLLQPLPLPNYAFQLLYLLLGTLILSYAIALEVHVDLIYLPLDGLYQAIAQRTGKGFDLIKTIIDCAMVIVALLIIVPLKHGLYGVREGTIISALIAGWLVNIFTRMLKRKGG